MYDMYTIRRSLLLFLTYNMSYIIFHILIFIETLLIVDKTNVRSMSKLSTGLRILIPSIVVIFEVSSSRFIFHLTLKLKKCIKLLVHIEPEPELSFPSFLS